MRKKFFLEENSLSSSKRDNKFNCKTNSRSFLHVRRQFSPSKHLLLKSNFLIWGQKKQMKQSMCICLVADVEDFGDYFQNHFPPIVFPNVRKQTEKLMIKTMFGARASQKIGKSKFFI
jgi:hypothetical protein